MLLIIASVLCLCMAAIGAEASIVTPVSSQWWLYPVGADPNPTILCGTSITLAVETNCTDELTYQWYLLTDEMTVPIEGATSDSYETGPLVQDMIFIVAAQDPQGTYRQYYFHVYVDNQLKANPLDEQDVWFTQPYGSVELITEASCLLGELHYQWCKPEWYYDEESDWYDWDYIPIEGATEETYMTEPIDKNCTYVCEVSDDYSSCENVYFYVRVENGLYAEAVGDTRFEVDAGESVTLRARGGCLQGETGFQWYSKTPLDSEYEPVESAVGTSFTIDTVDTHMNYACAVTDDFGSDKWVYYDVAVDNGFEAHAESAQDQYAFFGDTITLQVYAAVNEGIITYEWYSWEEDIFEGLDTTADTLSFVYTEGFPDVVYCTVTAPYGETAEFRFYIYEGVRTDVDIPLDEPMSLTAGERDIFVFRFVPEWRGIYTFSISNPHDMNHPTVLNSDGNIIAEGEMEGDHYVVSCLLEAGRLYFITTDPYNCSFEVVLTGERIVSAGSELRLPDSLKRIEQGAFENTAAVEVYIPDGCAAIGSNAFASCGELRIVHIPDSVISINRSAFGSDVLIVCESYWNTATRYAQRNGIPWSVEG